MKIKTEKYHTKKILTFCGPHLFNLRYGYVYSIQCDQYQTSQVKDIKRASYAIANKIVENFQKE